MSKRLMRALVVLSMGGTTLGFGFIGCQNPFSGNQPGANFLSATGNAEITSIVNQSLDIFKAFPINNADAAAARDTAVEWFRAPLTTLYTDIWSGWIGLTIAQDPTYSKLLVE